MYLRLVGSLVAVLLLAGVQARASDDIDMSTITCQKFLGSGYDVIPLMVTWIDGYMSAKSQNTTMSAGWMGTLTGHLGGFCLKNPEKTLLQAAESMGSKQVDPEGAYDLAATTCTDFLARDEKKRRGILAWLDGYMSTERASTLMSEAKMQKLGAHLGTYCAKNAAHTLMQAKAALPE